MPSPSPTRRLSQLLERRLDTLSYWREARRINESRLKKLSDINLEAVVAIAERPSIGAMIELRDVYRQDAAAFLEVWHSLPDLERAGLIRIYNYQGEKRCRALPLAGEKARAELERRERRLEGPGPHLGNRSRASGLAERQEGVA